MNTITLERPPAKTALISSFELTAQDSRKPRLALQWTEVDGKLVSRWVQE